MGFAFSSLSLPHLNQWRNLSLYLKGGGGAGIPRKTWVILAELGSSSGRAVMCAGYGGMQLQCSQCSGKPRAPFGTTCIPLGRCPHKKLRRLRWERSTELPFLLSSAWLRAAFGRVWDSSSPALQWGLHFCQEQPKSQSLARSESRSLTGGQQVFKGFF